MGGRPVERHSRRGARACRDRIFIEIDVQSVFFLPPNTLLDLDRESVHEFE